MYEYVNEPGFFAHHAQVFWTMRHTLLAGVQETLYMTGVTVAIAYALGLPLGVMLVCFNKGGLFPSRPLNAVLGFIINTVRSIPFIILMTALMPFSRFIIGSSIGTNAAIVALVVAATPFIARMVETALKEIDHGVIDAARSMGATNLQIIFKVMLPETVPTILRGVSITTIMVISFSAMAGALGVDGLGSLAIRYGLNRFESDVMLIIVVIIVVIVAAIQFFFNTLANKIDRRN